MRSKLVYKAGLTIENRLLLASTLMRAVQKLLVNSRRTEDTLNTVLAAVAERAIPMRSCLKSSPFNPSAHLWWLPSAHLWWLPSARGFRNQLVVWLLISKADRAWGSSRNSKLGSPLHSAEIETKCPRSAQSCCGKRHALRWGREERHGLCSE